MSTQTMVFSIRASLRARSRAIPLPEGINDLKLNGRSVLQTPFESVDYWKQTKYRILGLLNVAWLYTVYMYILTY